MESKKVKEIKKALEHCGEKVTCQGCPEYNNEPVIDWFKCKRNLLQKTITLINELESENERLLDQRNRTFNIWVRDTEKLKDRIAELKKENEAKTDTITDLLKKQEFYEKEKLTKFAERLKDSAGQNYVSQNGVRISDITYSISDGTINKILKEFLCDKHQ